MYQDERNTFTMSMEGVWAVVGNLKSGGWFGRAVVDAGGTVTFDGYRRGLNPSGVNCTAAVRGAVGRVQMLLQRSSAGTSYLLVLEWESKRDSRQVV